MPFLLSLCSQFCLGGSACQVKVPPRSTMPAVEVKKPRSSLVLPVLAPRPEQPLAIPLHETMMGALEDCCFAFAGGRGSPRSPRQEHRNE